MEALFPEKRTIYHAPADLMMRHWVGEAAPELDHPHADAACSGATSSSKYSICAYWLAPSSAMPPCEAMLWGCWAPAGSASARGSAYRPLVPWPQTETPASKKKP